MAQVANLNNPVLGHSAFNNILIGGANLGLKVKNLAFAVFSSMYHSTVVTALRSSVFAPIGQLALNHKLAAIAISALSISLIAVTGGLAIHLVGLGLGACHFSAPLLVTLTSIITKVGETLFLVGAVPLYALFWELPKRLVILIPKLPRVIMNVAMKIASKVTQVASFVVNKLLLPAASFIKDKITFVSRKLFEHVILPFARFVKYAAKSFVKIMKKIVIKLGEIASKIALRIKNIAKYIYTNALVPLWNNILVPFAKKTANMVISIAKSTFNYIIKPFWNHIIVGAFKLARFCLVKICKAIDFTIRLIDRLIRNLITKVIIPVFSKLFKLTKKTVAFLAKNIFKYVIKPFWNYVIVGGCRLLRYCMVKIAKAFNFTIRLIGLFIKNILLPACFWLFNKAKYAAEVIVNFVFNNMLTPLWKKGVVPVAKLLGRLSVYLARATSYICRKVAKAFVFSITKGVIPLLKATYRSSAAIVNAVIRGGKYITNSLIIPVAVNVKNASILVATATAGVILALYQNAIEPFIKKVLIPVVIMKTKKVVFDVFTKICKTSAKAFVKTATFIKEKVVLPTSRAFSATLIKVKDVFIALIDNMYNKVLSPLGSTLNTLMVKGIDNTKALISNSYKKIEGLLGY